MSDRDDNGWSASKEPSLPSRFVLDSWVTPEPAPDLTDRIMAQLQAHPSHLEPVATKPVGTRVLVAVTSVVLAAAAALVLTFVTTFGHRDAVYPAPSDAPDAPVVVAGGQAVTADPVDRGLVIRTNPHDSTVTVDGELVDGQSPFYVTLDPGQHRVRVDRAGYMPLERTVATNERSTELPFDLQLREVVLVLSTDPPEAEVTLIAGEGRTALGRDGSRFALMRKDGVTYEVEGSAPGYAARRVPLSFTGGQDQVVHLTLVPLTGAADPDDPPAPRPIRSPSLKDPFKKAPPRASKRSNTPDLEDPFKRRQGTLRIGTPAGVEPATVFVDGRRVGRTPIPGAQSVAWSTYGEVPVERRSRGQEDRRGRGRRVGGGPRRVTCCLCAGPRKIGGIGPSQPVR